MKGTKEKSKSLWIINIYHMIQLYPITQLPQNVERKTKAGYLTIIVQFDLGYYTNVPRSYCFLPSSI